MYLFIYQSLILCINLQIYLYVNPSMDNQSPQTPGAGIGLVNFNVATILNSKQPNWRLAIWWYFQSKWVVIFPHNTVWA